MFKPGSYKTTETRHRGHTYMSKWNSPWYPGKHTKYDWMKV